MTEQNLNTALNLGEIELVDFRIFGLQGNQPFEGIYGINVAKVQEIIMMPEIFEFPTNLDYVLGVFDLRSTVIPLIDLSKWLGIVEDEKRVTEKVVVITEFSSIKMGFVVHVAKRIRRIDWGNVEPAAFSSHSTLSKDKITGTTKIDGDKTMLILDLESILNDLQMHIPKAPKPYTKKQETKKFDGIAMFVDDSKSARTIIKRTLLKMGFKVVEAVDGKDGLAKLEMLYNQYQDKLGQHLKIIVSDVEMPKMDGYHFFSKIQEDPRFYQIPVLFNSSICDDYSAQKALDLGAKGYLVKFDVDRFMDEVGKILG
ncbi:chemotaxis protein [Helicobacter heilmannii]|uniref:Chemotaxis protein CheV n=1 Tax=Helicobacter heilmannii TaxID=35817 RepID=A0A0K2Y5P8_HELHE|nr:chemotaxis protein [Helicobacter heilmannii]BDQ26925.1 fused signal transduction protein/response regulator [Helicobacter heilmannii]GMB94330.1 Chemotaxis protein CheV [Helicobacter heilmannii]CCM12364.1 Chemotaxis protein CheV [Helicobacter heilmannii ASB1.4]CRI34491.1 Chemotaxis protein CheV [Helicobacter heilmannii]